MFCRHFSRFYQDISARHRRSKAFTLSSPPVDLSVFVNVLTQNANRTLSLPFLGRGGARSSRCRSRGRSAPLRAAGRDAAGPGPGAFASPPGSGRRPRRSRGNGRTGRAAAGSRCRFSLPFRWKAARSGSAPEGRGKPGKAGTPEESGERKEK